MKICPLCDVAYPEPHTRCPQDGALLLESREFAPGQVVRGKYKIVRKIGQGGMGTVYLAEDTFLNAQMALKFLSGELSSDPSFTRRFRDEARAAFKLRHPNIVEVNGLDQSDDGSLFIAMEFVDGLSLRGVLELVGGPLAVPRAIEIAHGIAGGLGAAHLNGFVHRDIKPENIVVSRQGEKEHPKILDFGIVAVIERAQADDAPSQRLSRGPILTAEYAAPEQWSFAKPEDLDGRTDIYALGCVFYEMLTGRLPFSANSYEGWMDQHLKAVPAPPSAYSPEISRYPGVDELVLWTLQKKRDDRPHVKQFLEALDAIPKTPVPLPKGPPIPVRAKTYVETGGNQDGKGVRVPPPSAERSPETWKAPSNGLVYGAAGFVLIVLLALGGYWLKGHKANEGNTEVVKEIAKTNPVDPVPIKKMDTKPVPHSNTPTQPQPIPITPQPVAPLPVTPSGMEKQAQIAYDAGDFAKAVALRNQSCSGGDMAACYQLGFNYSNAKGVPKNMAKFEELESKACTGDYPEACVKLGALYLSEVGFKDKEKAAHFYDLACKEGSREGCYFSGKLYELGSGVPRDPVKAQDLFTKSCRMSYEKACDALKAKP